ncbi:leucyl aminopeptidase [Marinagarivorans algicola]|uniref:leucyl aminopeptidase n=1 Tax=Marinagarivorans algicola TaxID=1513270 RepID=UPI0006B92B6F|nr:leucyl aminopeptidase [Marinagarivorans algicola]
MDFLCKTADFNQFKTECTVIFTAATNTLSAIAQNADTLCEGQISRLIKSGDFKNQVGNSAWFYPSTGKSARILVVATGLKTANASLDSETFISLAEATAQALCSKSLKQASIHLNDIAVEDQPVQWISQTLSSRITSAAYRYTQTKKVDELPLLAKVTLCTDKAQLTAAKKGATLGAAVGQGINTARTLGDLPGNICTPTYLANEAKLLAKKSTKFTTKIVEAAEMKKLGMGSLLSVSAGSDQPPKLIVMEYKGKASKAPNVIVGKGITFDTGGISLKAGAGMDEMKYDMCGAASVLGTMHTLVELGAPVHVVAVIAAAENMPSGRATKPGDVVTSMSGKTIEVLNTDAEGRLVLCDALTYVERFKPKSVVDIATLTGACVIALGHHATGLFSNEQALADKLLEAGKQTHDRAWQMPLWDDYKKSLKSNFADLANIGGREAGSVTAACFLSYFTESYPWAHLDVAGTAWNSGANKGATGRPVSLLVNYLLNNA